MATESLPTWHMLPSSASSPTIPYLKHFPPVILNSGSFFTHVPISRLCDIFFRLYFLHGFLLPPIQIFLIFKTQLRHDLFGKPFPDPMSDFPILSIQESYLSTDYITLKLWFLSVFLLGWHPHRRRILHYISWYPQYLTQCLHTEEAQ